MRMEMDRSTPRPRRRRRDSMLCRYPGCDLPHEFLQFQGKYYCLECYDKATGESEGTPTTTTQIMKALGDVASSG